MNCELFRTLIPMHRAFPVPREVWDTPEGEAWTEHRLSCEACFDACYAFDLKRRGLEVSDFPCVHAGEGSTCDCPDFRDTGRCDNLTFWRESDGQFCIATRDCDLVGVRFCPRCGVPWPESSRTGWVRRELPTEKDLRHLGLPEELRAFLVTPPPSLDVTMPRSRVLRDSAWLERIRKTITTPGAIPFLVDPIPRGTITYCFELESQSVVLFASDGDELERWNSFAEWLATLGKQP